MNRIGTVEILALRTYPLDFQSSDPATQVVVEPGVYPLYEAFGTKFWLMEGVINMGGFSNLGDGLFMLTGGDVLSDIPVKFPSQRYGEDEWQTLLDSPVCDPDSYEYRLVIMERIQYEG